MHFLSENGFDYVAMEKSGIVSPVVSVQSNYKKTVTYGETVRIEVFVKKITGAKLVLGYDMYKENGELCNTGESSHCFTKEDGRIVRFKEEYPESYKKFLNMTEKGDVKKVQTAKSKNK